MPGKGRPPTPTAVLKNRGSWRGKAREKAGEPLVEAASTVPQPPAVLTAAERNIWFDMARHVVALRIMADGDWREFARYCRLQAAWDACVGIDEMVKLNPAIKAVVEKFGLTPADRTRVRVEKKTSNEDKDDKFFGGMKIAK